MKEISSANLCTASEIKRDSGMTKLQQMLIFLYLFLFSTRVFYSIILSSSPFGHGLVLNSEAKGFLVVCRSCWLLGALLSVLDTSRTSDHRDNLGKELGMSATIQEIWKSYSVTLPTPIVEDLWGAREARPLSVQTFFIFMEFFGKNYAK